MTGPAPERAPWEPGPSAALEAQPLVLDHAAVDLQAMPGATLAGMAAAGAEVREWERILARTGDNVVGELLRLDSVFREWAHCPKGDVYDPESRSQYYYHAHPRAERAPGEHGHFHLFLRDRPTGRRAKPGRAAQAAARKDPGSLCHLIGLSMDKHGRLIRLFTTNQWVTGEVWRPAGEVTAKLDRFGIGHARPSWPANRWITAIVDLFRPQIEALIDARDQVLDDWRRKGSDRDVLEDRALNVTSEMWVSVPDQIRAVDRARDGHAE